MIRPIVIILDGWSGVSTNDMYYLLTRRGNGKKRIAYKTKTDYYKKYEYQISEGLTSLLSTNNFSTYIYHYFKEVVDGKRAKLELHTYVTNYYTKAGDVVARDATNYLKPLEDVLVRWVNNKLKIKPYDDKYNSVSSEIFNVGDVVMSYYDTSQITRDTQVITFSIGDQPITQKDAVVYKIEYLSGDTSDLVLHVSRIE